MHKSQAMVQTIVKILQNAEENSRMRKAAERTAPIWVLQAVLPEVFEDHLGVALIQPGGSRYEQMKWQKITVTILKEIAVAGMVSATRVEPRIYVPCNRNIVRDFLYAEIPLQGNCIVNLYHERS